MDILGKKLLSVLHYLFVTDSCLQLLKLEHVSRVCLIHNFLAYFGEVFLILYFKMFDLIADLILANT